MHIILGNSNKSQQLILDINNSSVREYEILFSNSKSKLTEAVCQSLIDNEFLRLFFEYLSSKPYCTDILGKALLIRPKSTAITKFYIQPNPIHCVYWLILDLDYNVQKYWYDEFPVPNMTIGNPVNGHQHIMYLLKSPVYKLQNARLKPLQLLADVERGLSIRFNADLSYGKLISKNPLHPYWQIVIWHTEPYELNKLLVHIPDKFHRKKSLKPKDELGVGRNCSLFDEIRYYAYNQAHKVRYEYNVLFDRVYAYALEYNQSFLPPLEVKEVKCTVRSVCKWTTKKMDTAGFIKWCSVRGKLGNIKSQIVRGVKSQEKADKAKALYAEGKTQKEIALFLGVDQSWVSRLLKN